MSETTQKLHRPAHFYLRLDGCGNAEINTKFRRENIPYLLKAMGIVDGILAIDENEDETDAALAPPSNGDK